jgi:hypothetical protein
VHFTLGGPYFDEYRECDYAEEWFSERRAMTHVAEFVQPVQVGVKKPHALNPR